jgi:serine/threonine protein kinase
MPPPPNREVALFSAALELDAGQRGAYLAEVCADDPALRLHLEALLRVHEQAITLLETPAAGARDSPIGSEPPDATTRIAPTPTEKAGDRIGRYKLLQQIGEGGCGIVYMAEQEEPVRRRVALKVIKLGMDTKQVIARFEAERQALALMDHPHIAKVFDAGATEAGRPYFVMELVRGIKITDYCDENNLSTEDRLKLFTQVCQAIQHAHQKGIIHRDIKPSNILVTISEPGAAGRPKVIDFGIAKATSGQRLTDKTVFTAFEQFIGTPAYMSPEQAMMTGLDIDTRTDIYALGVLLYKLLTGKTPFEAKRLLEAGLDEIRRIIREEEPVRPSTRLHTLEVAEQTTLAKHRQSEPPKLVHLLRGDLDWIVMKALEKDRTRRYETANGLAMDVQRHLADEPVVARPPSRLYRLEKLARRNKRVFAAGAAVLLALVGGLAVSNWFFFREKAARRRAVTAEQKALRSEGKARVINRFLTEDLLFQATPDQNAWEKQVTMEEVLKRATGLLDKDAEIARDPEVEATLRLDFGSTYLKLNALDEAERNLRRAFDLRTRELGPTNRDTLAAEVKLGEFLIDHAQEFIESERLFLEVWEGRRRALGDTHLDTLEALEGYEIVLYKTGRVAEAERIARQILPSRERALGPDHHDTISALNNLAACVCQRGDYAQAERLNREALHRCQRKGYKTHGFVAAKQVALQRLFQDDPEEADKLVTEAWSEAARELGPEDLFTLWLQRVVARTRAENGRWAEAEGLARKTLDARRRHTSDLEGTGRTLLILGRVLVEQGKLEDAEVQLQQALTDFRDGHVGTREALIAQTENWLGAIQVARKAYPEAEALLLRGPDQFFATDALMSPNERRVAVGHIVKLYEAWNKPVPAATWRRRLDELPATVGKR